MTAPRFLLSILAMTALLTACEQPAETHVTPPDENGIPTHVPALAPQAESLQRASKVDAQMQESADQTRAAIDEATQ